MDADNSAVVASLRMIALLASQLVRRIEGEQETEELDQYVRKPAPSASRDGPVLTLVALREYRGRRLREQILGQELFSGPAWDILVDLFVQGSSGKRVAIKEACIAAHVPATTALRYIELLESDGLIVRHMDPADARRRFLSLTAEGRKKMELILRCQLDGDGIAGSMMLEREIAELTNDLTAGAATVAARWTSQFKAG